jgi:hypothetical protein
VRSADGNFTSSNAEINSGFEYETSAQFPPWENLECGWGEKLYSRTSGEGEIMEISSYDLRVGNSRCALSVSLSIHFFFSDVLFSKKIDPNKDRRCVALQ